MHPTADTPPVIYFQTLGAAGDAGRWAARDAKAMKQIIESIIGGMLVMTSSAVLWLFGAKSFFIWVLAWPALILRPLFPPPSPDQVFPVLGGYAGIFTTLIAATLTYSALIYLALRLSRAPKRLP